MANTSKQSKVTGLRAPAPSASVEISEPLSPKVEGLRKLVASGQYQVSSRYLAIQIFRRSGLRTE
jgi:anti-sigma28 factor (negative regulator of flagellin synthesis)